MAAVAEAVTDGTAVTEAVTDGKASFVDRKASFVGWGAHCIAGGVKRLYDGGGGGVVDFTTWRARGVGRFLKRGAILVRNAAVWSPIHIAHFLYVRPSAVSDLT